MNGSKFENGDSVAFLTAQHEKMKIVGVLDRGGDITPRFFYCIENHAGHTVDRIPEQSLVSYIE